MKVKLKLNQYSNTTQLPTVLDTPPCSTNCTYNFSCRLSFEGLKEVTQDTIGNTS